MPELLNTLDGLIVAALVLCAFGLTARYLWRAVRPAASHRSESALEASERTTCSGCQVAPLNQKGVSS